MIRSAVVALAAMILCGCKEAPPPQQTAPDEFTVAVHWQDSAEDLQAVAHQHGERDAVDGFAVMTSRGDEYRCDIYTVKPRDLSIRAQGLLGHEFAHCLFGAWHP